MSSLLRLVEAGQNVWLDYLRRSLVVGGGLRELIQTDGVGGLTSNPAIFRKALAESADYDQDIRTLTRRATLSPRDVFYELALEDIRTAADEFRLVYDRTEGRDGFVSFELDPELAHNTDASVEAGKELIARIDRPNVLIKVPGTDEGVRAVEELTAQGVNVNITLLFSVDMYERVAYAYISGLERRLRAGQPLGSVASVASFFVSRVDTAVEALLDEGSPLAGRVAIANARVAYKRFGEIFSSTRWERLADAGARVQRSLWASTGTENPRYSDMLYVEALVVPNTVTTMPEATLDAFRDHGRVRMPVAAEEIEEAEATLCQLGEAGIDLQAISDRLVESGIVTFEKDLAELLAIIEAKVQDARTSFRGRSRRVTRKARTAKGGLLDAGAPK